MDSRHTPKTLKQAAEVLHLRAEGQTFAQIGKRFGFSRQRAEQLSKFEGLRPCRVRRCEHVSVTALQHINHMRIFHGVFISVDDLAKAEQGEQ
jgi:hypothetical protein